MAGYATSKGLGKSYNEPIYGTPNMSLNNFMGSLGGGMGNLPSIQTPSPIPAPPKLDMSTERDPRLERLAGGFENYVGELRTGTTPAITGYMQEVEAARRGGAKRLRDINRLAGRATGQGAGEYEAETQRQMSGAGRQAAQLREQMLQNAMTGAVGAAQAPMQGQLAQGQLGLMGYQTQLAAWQAAQQANQANQSLAFNQLSSLRDMQLQNLMMGMGGGQPTVKGLGVRPYSLA